MTGAATNYDDIIAVHITPYIKDAQHLLTYGNVNIVNSPEPILVNRRDPLVSCNRTVKELLSHYKEKSIQSNIGNKLSKIRCIDLDRDILAAKRKLKAELRILTLFVSKYQNKITVCKDHAKLLESDILTLQYYLENIDNNPVIATRYKQLSFNFDNYNMAIGCLEQEMGFCETSYKCVQDFMNTVVVSWDNTFSIKGDVAKIAQSINIEENKW